ncbi:MAG: c-type cytochrome [Planctomycetes bacterium]|nr:c-type cytochrome [Planctomycetota bacterium]
MESPVKRTVASRVAAMLVLCAFLSVPGWSQSQPSEETTQFFRQNCASCHTIGGGPLAGPDLKGAHERREAKWLTAFIQNPKQIIDGGDPVAAALVRDARGVVMPTIPGIDASLAEKLVALIAAESALERSAFAGLQISDRALTEEDVRQGERLFLGRAAFASGAPPCISCHAVEGIAGLGGGRIGPDLTEVYARLEGRKALAAWLSAPPSPVMQPVFSRQGLDSDEVLALVAYLKDAANSGAAQAAPNTLKLVLGGVLGALALLVLFDIVWRKRYRATRRPLVHLPRRRVAAEIHS